MHAKYNAKIIIHYIIIRKIKRECDDRTKNHYLLSVGYRIIDNINLLSFVFIKSRFDCVFQSNNVPYNL